MKRILRNNPASLKNSDFDDKSNTSLHLAAIVGHIEIIVRELCLRDPTSIYISIYNPKQTNI